MRRIGRIVVLGAAAVIVVGTVASAAPGLRASVGRALDGAAEATGATGETAGTGPTGTTSAGPGTGPSGATGGTAPSGPTGHTATTGPTGATQPTDPFGVTGSPVPGKPSEDDAQGPDFSSCEGLTGLDNAVCRHEILLAVHPENDGLHNALDHLIGNRDRHASAEHGNPHGHAAEHGNPHGSGEHGNPHGSGEHGNSHGDSGEHRTLHGH